MFRKSGKNLSKLTELRLVLERNGHMDGDDYYKPQWAVLFIRDDIPCRIPVKCGGDRRPLGCDIIEAMILYVRQGRVTEAQLLDIRIIDAPAPFLAR